MFSIELILLGLALAMDAAVATFAIGLISHEVSPSEKAWRGFFLAGIFGLFQFGMLWLGSYGGSLFTFSDYGYLFQFVVAGIFLFIAAKLFHESTDEKEKEIAWSYLQLLGMGVVTSFDALAAGISFGTIPLAYIPALYVGLITFGVCALFYGLSQFFKDIPERWLLRFAGLIFLGLGGNIVWNSYMKGIL